MACISAENSALSIGVQSVIHIRSSYPCLETNMVLFSGIYDGILESAAWGKVKLPSKFGLIGDFLTGQNMHVTHMLAGNSGYSSSMSL